MLISAHGTQIVSKLRPADHLRQLLIDNGGADNDVVKAFFEMHSEVQAAATALVLACSQSVQDAQESTWIEHGIVAPTANPTYEPMSLAYKVRVF